MIIRSFQNLCFFLATLLVTLLLFIFKFNVETKELLDVFVPLVWGIFLALGGSLVKLNRKEGLSDAQIEQNNKAQGFAVYLAIQMVLFLFLATIYPANSFLKNSSVFLGENWIIFSILYDSLCFSLFCTTGLGAVIIAGSVLIEELRAD